MESIVVISITTHRKKTRDSSKNDRKNRIFFTTSNKVTPTTTKIQRSQVREIFGITNKTMIITAKNKETRNG